MKALDRSRPFAQICGGSFKHAFEQDGMKFDAAGALVEDAGQPAAPAGASVPDQGPELAMPSLGVSIEQIMQATALLEKRAEELIAEVEDQSDQMLQVLLVMEAAGRKRVSVKAAIEDQIKRREPPADQVDAQMGA